MTQLANKNKPFVWTPKFEQNFQLKERLVKTPVLKVSGGTRNLVVYSEALGKGLDCVIMHNGKIIAYDSRH